MAIIKYAQFFHEMNSLLFAIYICTSWIFLKRHQRHKKKYELIKIENKKGQQIEQTATQVVHDIRSPLAALEAVIRNTSEISQPSKQLLVEATSRIRSIIKDLSTRTNFLSSHEVRVTDSQGSKSIEDLIESIVAEKRIIYCNNMGISICIQVKRMPQSFCSDYDYALLARIISNLIDNAVEAIVSRGTVNVICSSMGKNIRLEVHDTGKGIPSEVLIGLGSYKNSFGKRNGSGLGLYHARRVIESWSGTLEIKSVLGVGTHIVIELPKKTLLHKDMSL
jgi:signal transduction histidine kinase